MKKITEMLDRKHGVINADITTDKTGAVYYDMAGFGKVVGVLITDTVADTKKAGIQLLQAKDAAGTDSKDLGTIAEETSSGDQTLVVTKEIDAVEMDSANDFTFVGVKVSSDDIVVVIGAAVILRGRPRYLPV